MRALILAAGLGTRLRPLTDTMPKALVPANGKPMIEYSLDFLDRQGIKEVRINISYLGEQLKLFLEENKQRWRLDISIQDESEKLLGSGGAIAQAAGWLFENNSSAILWNPDGLFFPNISELAKEHKENIEKDCLLSISLMKHNEAGRKHDGLVFENGRVIGASSGENGQEIWHFPGLMFIESGVADILPKAGEVSDTYRDLWKPLWKSRQMGAVFYDGPYQDMGTVADLEEAENNLKSGIYKDYLAPTNS